MRKLVLSFSILVFSFYAIVYFNQKHVVTNELIENYLSENYSKERVEDMLSMKSNRAWYTYLLNPAILFVKLNVFAVVILTAFVFIELKVNYAKILAIVTVAYFAFLLPILFKLVYFTQFVELTSVEQYDRFKPYSLLHYLNNVPEWIRYPIYLVNTSEILFVIIITAALKRAFSLTVKKSVAMVLSSYGLLTVFLAVVVSFLNVMLE